MALVPGLLAAGRQIYKALFEGFGGFAQTTGPTKLALRCGLKGGEGSGNDRAKHHPAQRSSR